MMQPQALKLGSFVFLCSLVILKYPQKWHSSNGLNMTVHGFDVTSSFSSDTKMCFAIIGRFAEGQEIFITPMYKGWMELRKEARWSGLYCRCCMQARSLARATSFRYVCRRIAHPGHLSGPRNNIDWEKAPTTCIPSPYLSELEFSNYPFWNIEFDGL